MKIAISLVVLVAGWCIASPAFARQWTDASGVFSVEAELVEVLDGQVRLRREDGSVVTVPIDRLSKDDQRHLASLDNKRQPRQLAGAARIREALQHKSNGDFVEAPLSDVVAFFADLHQVPHFVDWHELEKIGVGRDTPITYRGQAASYASLLDELLDPLKLTWVVRHEVLFITSQRAADAMVEPHVYAVLKAVAADDLIEELTRNIDPESWDEVGGPASLAYLPPSVLVVAQTPRNHREITRHYEMVLRPVTAEERGVVAIPGVKLPVKVLSANSVVDFVETPLTDVAAFLGEFHRVRIRLNKAAGVKSDLPVTARLRNVSLANVLTLLLSQHELTWTADENGITITTPHTAKGRLILSGYPVDELVKRGDAVGLIEAVKTVVAPTTWDEVGGPASIRLGVRGTLDVRQSFGGQQRVAVLLADLRRPAADGSVELRRHRGPTARAPPRTHRRLPVIPFRRDEQDRREHG